MCLFTYFENIFFDNSRNNSIRGLCSKMDSFFYWNYQEHGREWCLIMANLLKKGIYYDDLKVLLVILDLYRPIVNVSCHQKSSPSTRKIASLPSPDVSRSSILVFIENSSRGNLTLYFRRFSPNEQEHPPRSLQIGNVSCWTPYDAIRLQISPDAFCTQR